MKIYMYALILLLAAAILCGCTKTTDKLITADELCMQYKDLQDPNNLRDKHDECLIFEGDRLSEKAECASECNVYCSEIEMDYMNSWTNFDGCHCTCSGRAEIKR